MEISEKKKEFLESIGIDVNSLPNEFNTFSYDMERLMSDDEMTFFNSESLIGTSPKEFCLRDLVGTMHPDYSDKSWIEVFLSTKRGDDAVRQYFLNPEYYTEGLRSFDQSRLNHDSPIELYEKDGQFFIKGGNNRLALIMMKYLAEVSKIENDKQRAQLDEQYTFVAEVSSLPRDKDIVSMINMLKDSFGAEIRIRNIATKDDECRYEIRLQDSIIEVQNKEELGEFIKKCYEIDNVKGIQEFIERIYKLVNDKIMYQGENDKCRILQNLFPDLEPLEDGVLKLKELGLENEFFANVELEELSIIELVNKINLFLEKQQEKTEIEEKTTQEPQIINSEKYSINEFGEIIRDSESEIQKASIQVVDNVQLSAFEEQQEKTDAEEEISQEVATLIDEGYSINEFGEIIRGNETGIQNLPMQTPDNTQLSFGQKIAQLLQKSGFLMNISFVESFVNNQLNEMSSQSHDGKLPPIRQMSNSEKITRMRTIMENDVNYQESKMLDAIRGCSREQYAERCAISSNEWEDRKAKNQNERQNQNEIDR